MVNIGPIGILDGALRAAPAIPRKRTPRSDKLLSAGQMLILTSFQCGTAASACMRAAAALGNEMIQVELSPAWYVLHTKSRAENVVSEGLTKKHVEVFLPKITVQSRRKDRRKMIRLPLFPGYVFVRTDLSPGHHLEIVKTAGAVKLVGSTHGPIPVPKETIQSLQIMVATDAPITTGFMFTKGDPVMVISGPFSGVIGIFDHYRGQGRIIVHIEALGQFASVEVDACDVEKIPEILSR